MGERNCKRDNFFLKIEVLGLYSFIGKILLNFEKLVSLM